ncbi:MAG: transcription-repair coupling factor [Ignavibacteriaceae bacterium]|nr:transcription-repair coupling factor [Ignavibacteriaceae bacterium]
MKSVFELTASIPSIKNLVDVVVGSKPRTFYTSTFFGSTKNLLVKILSESESQIFLLCEDAKMLDEYNAELNILGLSEKTILFNNYKSDAIQEKLTEITSRNNFILLSTYDLIAKKLPAKDLIKKNTTEITPGGDLSYENLIEYLNLLNYQKENFVEAPGEYSQRGAIVDFWSYSEVGPVRLEFDGDFLESIRSFDPESQRSIETISKTTLAGELRNASEENTSSVLDYLNNPVIICSQYALDNISNSPMIIENEPRVELPSPLSLENELDNEFPDTETLEPKKDYSTFNVKKLTDESAARWIIEEEISSSSGKIDLGFSDAPSIASNYEVLFKTLKDFSSAGFNILLTAENDLQSKRLGDLIIELHEEMHALLDSGQIKIETLALKKGFVHKQSKLLVLTDYQIFNKPYRTKVIARRKAAKSKAKSFSSIKRGDFVVHEDYGIGKYSGLETIKIGDANQETMKILYAEGGVVYVNLNYLHLVKRYSSQEKLAPTLSTLGTSEWQNTKQRAKKKIKEAARELINLYARRKATKGYSFAKDTVWQKELEASFIYEDTEDQQKVTEDVKQDMEAENPMDRLVCGDVGFGKTEVAVRAAFKAAQDGKQTAVLVPTTILAEQHFNTFTDRLSQFPIKVAAISRFQTKKEQAEIVDNLAKGKIDVVVGTHRLLSKDIKFKDLGLLIIDEEHRFGVMSKEKLRSLKHNVDTLTLTATPIPRTLNLSLLGARDLSIIATPPPNRQPIYTHVSTFDVLKIKDWITNELNRNGQVYFVHDRVESIDKLAAYLNKYIPDIKIGIAHGQMKPAQLEKVIHGFLNKQYDVLLSTKIIESGIDIPNVNTIIVNRADRFGLAELHQLRGRVGRAARQAYAYFIVPSLSSINKKALRRLQAIEEFTELGAGFNISMRDLEIRGAGNLLGIEQTGFVNDVGFDLFVKLINEAVEELKYEEFKELFQTLPKPKEKSEPTIDTYFDIGIPQTYMPEQSDRLNFYTALYSVSSIDEIDDLSAEMKDRFGSLPTIVDLLISTARLKYYASQALFDRVIIQRKNIFLILPRGENEDYYKHRFTILMKHIMEKYSDTVKFNQQKETMRLVIINNFASPAALLESLIVFTKDISLVLNQEINKISETA